VLIKKCIDLLIELFCKHKTLVEVVVLPDPFRGMRRRVTPQGLD